ncbi:hypothetical protein C8A00DRAFT_29425 [Chaetomidium leptoderma]|uniref:Uncharacterized protein n=1 Tax=Chaetomidium leptoderma TaxID=669021 RepID=A0AAN7A0I4_9PEZI|nr:hypothetical protein C8A00DRAFT_29425 [Chaetomidium leptoderma]
MSSRRGRAAAQASAEQAAQPAAQNQDYAFNMFGWSMRIPDGTSREEPIVLNAYKPTTTPWERAATSMQTRGEQPWRPSLSLTPRERDAQDEAGVSQYLVVGFTIPGLKPDHFKKHPSQKKQMPVGVQLDPTSIISGTDLPHPILVVVRIQETEPEGTVLYALLNPQRGLCTPHHIGQKGCFYLPIFRDSTTDLKTRGPAWNKLVQKVSIRPTTQRPQPQSAKQAFKKARSTAKLVLDPARSLQCELSLLVESFIEFGQPWHIKEARRVVGDAEHDLDHIPKRTQEALKDFVDNGITSWSTEYSEKMIDDFYELWPETRERCELTPTDIGIMKGQVLAEGLQVQFRFLRSFVLLCKRKMRKREAEASGSEPDMSNICATILELVMDVFDEPAAAIPMDMDRPLIMAIKGTLERYLETSRKFDRELKETMGDQLFAKTTLPGIFAAFSDATDVDTAKLMYSHAMRYIIAAYKHRHRGLGEKLEDLVETLDKGLKDLKIEVINYLPCLRCAQGLASCSPEGWEDGDVDEAIDMGMKFLCVHMDGKSSKSNNSADGAYSDESSVQTALHKPNGYVVRMPKDKYYQSLNDIQANVEAEIIM